MKLTAYEYNNLMQNEKVPDDLKRELASTALIENWLFVGTDFSGQENVVLSNLLYPYDNGRLDDIINKGSKDNGTDLHSLNGKACGVSRGDSKPLWFGLLYGSSSTLTGFSILGKKDYTDYTEDEWVAMEKKLSKRAVFIDKETWTPSEVAEYRQTGDWPERSKRFYPIKKGQLVLFDDQLLKQAIFGKHVQDKLIESTHGLSDLQKDLKALFKENGGVTTLGGRFIPSDSDHKMLNYSCQGQGAEAMKMYITIVHRRLKEANLVHGKHFVHQATVYDEIDMIVREDKVDTVVSILDTSYAMVSEELGMKVTFTGETLVGENWKDCH